MSKKLLFVSHTNPFYTSFGAEQRTSIIYRAFDSLGIKIDIAYIGDSPVEHIPDVSGKFYDFSRVDKSLSKLSGIYRLLLISMFPKSKPLAAAINGLIQQNEYDYIFCRYMPFAALCGLRRYADKLLLDIDDMPEQALQIDFSKKTGLKKLYFSLLRKAYRRESGKWIRSCRKCYVPNHEQAVNYGIGCLPNISSIWSYNKVECPNNLIFIGKLDWKPNYDGILHFLENCWNSIHEKFPEIKLFVGGKGIDEDTSVSLENKYPGVKFLGFVKDLNDFYSLGSIVICPIYSGAGTNIKIVEALSMGKTLIASRESTKGYEHFLEHNINCMIAEDDHQFIDEVTRAASDSDFARKIAAKGYEDVMGLYSIQHIESILSKDLSK